MKRLGLEPTPNSGAGWKHKEDGQSEQLIAQLKSTDAKSMRFNLDDFHKLEYNAIVAHKIPLFVMQFIESNDIFILIKPADLPSVAQYLETGVLDIVRNDIALDEQTQQEAKPVKVVKSGSRQGFWAQKEMEKEKEKTTWQKNSKRNR